MDDEPTGSESAAENGTTDPAGTSTDAEEASDSAGTSTGADPTNDAASETTAGTATFTMSGEVRRLASAPIAEGEDGIGTLYVGAFASCDHSEPPLGVFAMPDADLSDEAVEVPWTISGLPPGPIHFGLFLDDDDNAMLPTPLPDAGDPAYAIDPCDGLLSCLEFAIVDDDVTDVELVLNTTHPDC
jgi:hypothetical protein